MKLLLSSDDPFDLLLRSRAEIITIDVTGSEGAVRSVACALGGLEGVQFLDGGRITEPGNCSEGRVRFKVLAVVVGAQDRDAA